MQVIGWQGVANVGFGAACAAWGDNIAGTKLTLAELGGNTTQLKLNLVKPHASMRVAGDLTARNFAAAANDHVSAGLG